MRNYIGKLLRFLLKKKTILSVIFFLIGFYIPFFTEANIQLTRQQKIGEKKYHQFYNIELVHNKPEDELIVYPDPVNTYDLSGEKFGELMNTPLVYSTNRKVIYRDSLIEVQVYGWVWKESLDPDCRLNVKENIRYHSNTHIIARLNEGTLLDTIYTNELKSWTLISFSGFVPRNSLLTAEEFNDIPGYKKLFSNLAIKTTNTRRTGGVSAKPATRPLYKFEDFIWPVRLVSSILAFSFMIWFITFLYIPRRTQNKRKRRINIVILLVSGIVVGSILI